MIPGIVAAGAIAGPGPEPGEGVVARYWRLFIPQRLQSGAGTEDWGYMNLRMGLAGTIGGENLCTDGVDMIAPGMTADQSTEINSDNGAEEGFGYPRANLGTGGGQSSISWECHHFSC